MSDDRFSVDVVASLKKKFIIVWAGRLYRLYFVKTHIGQSSDGLGSRTKVTIVSLRKSQSSDANPRYQNIQRGISRKINGVHVSF